MSSRTRQKSTHQTAGSTPINTYPSLSLRRGEDFYGLLTNDPEMRRVFHIVEKAAQSDASVLLRGETGTGKELLAKALHKLSPRRGGPFHAISCAALPAGLLESELFGHVRGAFTDAVRDHPGHFRLANKGTLFLDEVAEMPLEVQAKLLRVLETRTIIPVGGRQSIAVDVRIISATHKSLRGEVDANRFRPDLMYRLRGVPIYIPTLSERGGDIPLLAKRFIAEFNQRASRRIERISPAAAAILAKHDWPGNVRELRNAIEYAFVVGEGPVLEPADLPVELNDLPQVLAEPQQPPAVWRGNPFSRGEETSRIMLAIEQAGGHVGQAAVRLGVSRVTLWRRMKKLELPEGLGLHK